jgi:hypothetical protein
MGSAGERNVTCLRGAYRLLVKSGRAENGAGRADANIAISQAAHLPRTPLMRFLAYVRPHLWLVAGGSVMGVLKFTLPLAFPLAFTYSTFCSYRSHGWNTSIA